MRKRKKRWRCWEQTFKSGKTRSMGVERNQLKALQRCYRQEESLVWCTEQDLHKCKFESFFEVNQLEHEIGEHLKHMDEWASEIRPTDLLNLPGSSFSLPDPLGLVCIIGAWNYPILLSLQPLVGAISAGNCVLLKMPSHYVVGVLIIINHWCLSTPIITLNLVTQIKKTMSHRSLMPTENHSKKNFSDTPRRHLESSWDFVHIYVCCIRVLEGDRHMTQAVLKGKYDKYFFTVVRMLERWCTLVTITKQCFTLSIVF